MLNPPMTLSHDERVMVELWDDDMRFEFEERAGIIEFDGKLSRSQAEKRAFDEVIKAISF